MVENAEDHIQYSFFGNYGVIIVIIILPIVIIIWFMSFFSMWKEHSQVPQGAHASIGKKSNLRKSLPQKVIRVKLFEVVDDV